MNISSFLKIVEIQTKAASVIPYLLGSIYAFYKYEDFSFKNAIIMFLAMLIFDMTTTAINNYIDYAKAIKKDGYGYETHNAIVKDNLKPKTVRILIAFMLLVSICLGVLLVINTNIVVLLLGGLAFLIGLCYSLGPIPISRTPFGEILSGLAMGYLLTFITIYIHIFDAGVLNVTFNSLSDIDIDLNLKELVTLFIVCLPAITGISNIMFANNICDMDEDIVNRRYTLPIYIGKEKALKLFRWIYYTGYIAIIVAVLIRAIPIYSILTIIVLKKVNANLEAFDKVQTKKDTFGLAIQNFAITNLALTLTILVGIIL